ncbi:MAG: esterase family protein [Tannerellaceae bacterium]|nr:esterase family protein [Tannerellaceae bacterium]
MRRRMMYLSLLLCCVATLVQAQRGRVQETLSVHSNILKMDRNYSIYLPAGYDESDIRYPVLYLLHGSGDDHTGWVQFGQVQHIADKAIAEGLAGPMIIVMPDANTGRRGYFNSAGGDFNYEDFFFKELIPHIEKTYRVRTEKRYRAVAGLSMGGGGSLFYALHHADMFAAAAPLSAATGSWSLDEYKSRLGDAKQTPQQIEDHFKRHSVEGILGSASEEELEQFRRVRWYFSCGDDDFLSEGNMRTHIAFLKSKIPHEFRVKDGAHTWTYWRMELPLVMEFVAKSFMQY